MFVTEIRPLNKKKSRILFDDGEDLVPASKSRRSFPMRFTKSWQGKC